MYAFSLQVHVVYAHRACIEHVTSIAVHNTQSPFPPRRRRWGSLLISLAENLTALFLHTRSLFCYYVSFNLLINNGTRQR